MDIETLIRNATEEELPAIASALKRANERPAILVTLRTGGRRYVVCQEDEHLFDDLVGLDEAQLAERVRHSLLVPFGAQWMRGYGRVDEMYRSLLLREVRRVTTADRARVWGR
jgi:hypothetical protein